MLMVCEAGYSFLVFRYCQFLKSAICLVWDGFSLHSKDIIRISSLQKNTVL
jgi:hypothetical protein